MKKRQPRPPFLLKNRDFKVSALAQALNCRQLCDRLGQFAFGHEHNQAAALILERFFSLALCLERLGLVEIMVRIAVSARTDTRPGWTSGMPPATKINSSSC